MLVVEMTVQTSESLRWGRIPRVKAYRGLFVSAQTFSLAEELFLKSLKQSDLVAWIKATVSHEQVLHICSTVTKLEKSNGLRFGYYVYFLARQKCRKYYRDYLSTQSSEQLTAITEPPTKLFKLGKLLDKRQSKVWHKIAKSTQETDILVEIHERTKDSRVKAIAFAKLAKVI